MFLVFFHLLLFNSQKLPHVLISFGFNFSLYSKNQPSSFIKLINVIPILKSMIFNFIIPILHTKYHTFSILLPYIPNYLILNFNEIIPIFKNLIIYLWMIFFHFENCYESNCMELVFIGMLKRNSLNSCNPIVVFLGHLLLIIILNYIILLVFHLNFVHYLISSYYHCSILILLFFPKF